MGDQEVQKPSSSVHHNEPNALVNNSKVRRNHRSSVPIGSFTGKQPWVFGRGFLSVPGR